ncbi:fimbria/pilus periplasmic chaperone, partial [Salmonella enterica]|uniref:fimbria/pilus periplasmic chaperone n=1 Tax=Salmonella enterica TaxID=28901 RepID=UPI001244F227
MNFFANARLLSCLLRGSLAHPSRLNLGHTPVIFYAEAKGASIPTSQRVNVSYLIQSWPQSISASAPSGDAPFMATPTPFRLNGGAQNIPHTDPSLFDSPVASVPPLRPVLRSRPRATST